MGSWADLTLADATLKGIAPVDMIDGNFGIFDTDINETNRLNEAKQYIEMRIVSNDALFAERADGPQEIMDAAIDINKTYIDNLIQRMIGYKYVQAFYETEAMGGNSLFLTRAEMMEFRFNETFTALMRVLMRDPDFFDQLDGTTDEDLAAFEGPRNWVG